MGKSTVEYSTGIATMSARNYMLVTFIYHSEVWVNGEGNVQKRPESCVMWFRQCKHFGLGKC